MEPTTPNSSPALPIAIVCGFALIAVAIFFTGGKDTPTPQASKVVADSEFAADETAVRPISENDYIRGNPNAPILLVEYSDYDCPFCNEYHSTMNQIMDEYGVTGKLAWVYRQFPLATLHPNSPKISEAALCVGDIADNDAFWKFTDLVFQERDLAEQTNITKLPQYAQTAGASLLDYNTCMDSKRMQNEVLASIQDGYNSGARGTPYTVLIVGDQQVVISGAQPYTTVKGIVKNLIEQLDGTFDPSTVEGAPALPTNESGLPVLE